RPRTGSGREVDPSSNPHLEHAFPFDVRPQGAPPCAGHPVIEAREHLIRSRRAIVTMRNDAVQIRLRDKRRGRLLDSELHASPLFPEREVPSRGTVSSNQSQITDAASRGCDTIQKTLPSTPTSFFVIGGSLSKRLRTYAGVNP